MNQSMLKLVALLSALALLVSLAARDGLSTEEETTAEPTIISKTQMPTANAEVLQYFNRLVNEAKKANPEFTMVKEPQVSEEKISNQTMQDLVPTLKQLMLNKTELSSEDGTTLSEALPVSGQEWASRLTTSDIRYAQCTQEGALYKITIHFFDEEEPAPLTSHHGKAFDMEDRAPVQKGKRLHVSGKRLFPRKHLPPGAGQRTAPGNPCIRHLPEPPRRRRAPEP